jgi:D-beta-D-heptose 7-phosphate kinase/D-beta-D-heptose 1-phosphate adenosyltransferase
MREKIHDARALAEILRARRGGSATAGGAAGDGGRRERIVFTNGCFDLLHVGHLRYLCEARTLGDCLIVAINDDASVRRLKGERRPVLKLRERLEVLAGLRCVDYVTWFGEDTPIPLLEMLRPDVLVKGANYPVEGVVGREAVAAWGAQVRVVALSEGRSTTGLIEKVLALREAKK